jgi:hypothetical protein
MPKSRDTEDLRIVKSREKYQAALDRLVSGQPEHLTLKAAVSSGKGYAINPTNVALEAGMSRDPLYARHSDVLEAIETSGGVSSEQPGRKKALRVASDQVRLQELRDEVAALKLDKARLATENLGLLSRLSVANARIERLDRDKARLTGRLSGVVRLRVMGDEGRE